MEAEIESAGARIVWVLESNLLGQPGSAESCRDFMDYLESEAGLCVGDGETEPAPGAWDESPFSVGRGFDLLVLRSDMVVAWTSSHGTPEGNENLTGEDVLEAVEELLAD